MWSMCARALKQIFATVSFGLVLTLLLPGSIASAAPIAGVVATSPDGDADGLPDTRPDTEADPDSQPGQPEDGEQPESEAPPVPEPTDTTLGTDSATLPSSEAERAAAESDPRVLAPEPLAGPVDSQGPITDAAVSTSGSDEAAIFAAVNRARIANCVPVVTRNPALDRVARNWTSRMAKSGQFFHNPAYYQEIPAGYFIAGENIAAGQRNGALMFESWMASPGHRANILTPQHTDLGVGFVRGGNSIYPTHGTQAFASYSQREKGVFLDVRPWSKFYREINWMGTQKLSTGNRVPGCGATKVTYDPKDQVSREAMAAFLYRLDKAKYRGPAVSPFSDVKPGHKFYNQITWMHAKGLANGTKVPGKKPKFAPQEAVSREAMAAFIYRYQNATAKAPATSPFADMKRGDKFYKEIAWMHATKLSTGNAQPAGKPKYAPKDRVSREAMGAFIYRLKH